MKDLLNEGIQQGLISFDEGKEFIRYVNHPKPLKYANPEEKIQSEAFLKLVLEYGYKTEADQSFTTESLTGTGRSKKAGRTNDIGGINRGLI